MFDDNIHRLGEQQGREQVEAARRIREDAIRDRMQRWGIEHEPAEYILDLELQVQELVKRLER